jgi:hypothetical protein
MASKMTSRGFHLILVTLFDLSHSFALPGNSWEKFFAITQRVGRKIGSMENRRSWVAGWRRELQDEEHEALVNLVNSLHIILNNASSQWHTTMELIVEQRQGFQQLHDEVKVIHYEVMELCSKPFPPAPSVSSSTISDSAFTLDPPR